MGVGGQSLCCLKPGHKERGSNLGATAGRVGRLREGPWPPSGLVWGDETLTRECEFSRTHKFFPTSWHLLWMYVWKLFQMFQSLCSSLSLGSILISLCQCSIQNTSGHPSGSVAVLFCAMFPLLFLERKQCKFPKCTVNLIIGTAFYSLFKGRS